MVHVEVADGYGPFGQSVQTSNGRIYRERNLLKREQPDGSVRIGVGRSREPNSLTLRSRGSRNKLVKCVLLAVGDGERNITEAKVDEPGINVGFAWAFGNG